jgi:aminoglycoside phosphotransferase (APT) family kinase protein
MARERPSLGEVAAFLSERYGEIGELEPLGGGFWSSAWGFTAPGRSLVVRFGADRGWFEADRAAMAFAGPDLPVPAVLDVGEAFGGAYAISVRAFGRPLESVEPERAAVAGPMLRRLLAALYNVPPRPDLPAVWHVEPTTPDRFWRDWLGASLGDGNGRAAVAAEPSLERLFRATEARIAELQEACPERGDLVHGDLLHGNVLVSDDASGVNAVFSWKCSLRGDFLYDTAWCTFWGAVHHPGIAAADAWAQIRSVVEPAALVDAPIRHHCYELHVGATHLGWYAWVDDRESLAKVAARLAALLERGPVSGS